MADIASCAICAVMKITPGRDHPRAAGVDEVGEAVDGDAS